MGPMNQHIPPPLEPKIVVPPPTSTWADFLSKAFRLAKRAAIVLAIMAALIAAIGLAWGLKDADDNRRKAAAFYLRAQSLSQPKTWSGEQVPGSSLSWRLVTRWRGSEYDGRMDYQLAITGDSSELQRVQELIRKQPQYPYYVGSPDPAYCPVSFRLADSSGFLTHLFGIPALSQASNSDGKLAALTAEGHVDGIHITKYESIHRCSPITRF
jgi:hypothetical protein